MKRGTVVPVLAWMAGLTAVVGGELAVYAFDSQGPTRVVRASECVEVVYPDGEVDWYCGDAPTIPPGAVRVEAVNLAPCASDDGSGPLPCHFDARKRGNGQGDSFTALPSGTPSGGVQRILIHFDSGATVESTVPAPTH